MQSRDCARGEGILIVLTCINHKSFIYISIFSVETSPLWVWGRVRAHQAFCLLHSTFAFHTQMPGDTVTLLLTIQGVGGVVQESVQAGI